MTIALGNWQTRRAEEKTAMDRAFIERTAAPPMPIGARKVDAYALQWSVVSARGEWLPQHTVLLDNRVFRQRAGYHVLTPLRLENSQTVVVVNRGWMPTGPSRTEPPQVPTPSGLVSITGTATLPAAKWLELRHVAPEGRVWQNFDMDQYRAATGLDIQPIVVLQASESPDALVREWDRPSSGADRNRAYAVQWYSFAAIALVLFIALSFKRATSKIEDGSEQRDIR